MAGIFGDYFERLSPLPNQAPQPAATPPGPFPIPRARPPVFYSAPVQTTAAAPPSPGLSDAPQQPGNSIANGIASGINNHALTLMALGAGIAQGGVGRGLELATSAAQAERNLQAQQVNHAQVYSTLTGAGVPPDEALAAVLNPSLMRTLAVKYLGPRASAKGAEPAAPSDASAQGKAASDAPPAIAGATAAPANTPALPNGVPGGSFFSRSRNLWEDRDGNLFDLQGRPVK